MSSSDYIPFFYYRTKRIIICSLNGQFPDNLSFAVVCNVLCHRQEVQVASHENVRATSVKTADRYRNGDLLPTHLILLVSVTRQAYVT